MAENRRKFVRVPLNTEVVCEIRTRSIKGMSWNISQGGMLFEGSQLRPLDEVQLSFRLPAAGVTVQATAIVVRVDEQQRVGIRFLKMNDAGRDGIRKLVDKEQ